MSTLNFGLRNGGGIGDSLPSNSWYNDSKEVYLLRSINDLSFMMIIILLFFNIIFGIIIDTFAGLRDEAAVMEDDMKNVCYICGTDRQTFDKDSANGFMHHIKKEHNLWKYVFFMIYMNSKDTTEYTGIETYVSNKVSDDDISWFPFNKAICLEASNY
jgi:inositol 1,4,5-triphosphate receptor type 1